MVRGLNRVESEPFLDLPQGPWPVEHAPEGSTTTAEDEDLGARLWWEDHHVHAGVPPQRAPHSFELGVLVRSHSVTTEELARSRSALRASNTKRDWPRTSSRSTEVWGVSRTTASAAATVSGLSGVLSRSMP